MLTDGVVSLRPWEPADIPEIVASVDGDEEMAGWLDRLPQPYTAEDARAFIAGEVVPVERTYAIVETATGRPVGSVGIHPDGDPDVGEIGYWIRRDARGRGLMTRAVVILSRHALHEGGFARVWLRADPENVGSCRVAEKAGFTREGVLRSVHWNERLRRRQDHVVYSLLPADLA
jgi:ribosomal-protein-alanine N-acetyltransferase